MEQIAVKVTSVPAQIGATSDEVIIIVAAVGSAMVTVNEFDGAVALVVQTALLVSVQVILSLFFTVPVKNWGLSGPLLMPFTCH